MVVAHYNKSDNMPIGVIPIDSIYTPISKNEVKTSDGQENIYDS